MAVLDVPKGRFHERRNAMVDQQIAGRGVRDPRVLDAMRRIPREEFVPERLREFAYDDTPLPIAQGQTISQPYVVALMIEALVIRPTDRVLEVGVGSGYASAVLGELASEVWAMDRHEELVTDARTRLRRLGADNVHVVLGNGTLGAEMINTVIKQDG